MQKKTIRQLVIDFFTNHPNIEFEHAPVVDWVTEQRIAMGYNPPRDVWRMVRQLHQDGKLVKVRKGVYKYDPMYCLRFFRPLPKTRLCYNTISLKGVI